MFGIGSVLAKNDLVIASTRRKQEISVFAYSPSKVENGKKIHSYVRDWNNTQEFIGIAGVRGGNKNCRIWLQPPPKAENGQKIDG